jgi:ferrochelatase
MASEEAVLLASHGTVDRLDDLRAFVTNVRRGHAPPDDLVAELRRRYEAIGGASPLNTINAEVARRLAARTGRPVAWANRLWEPYVKDRVAELAANGVRRVVLVPLAQHSAHVYAADARLAAAAHGVDVVAAPNWGRRADLCAAFASRVVRALEAAPGGTALVMTAHSLPKSVVEAGDPYESEVRAAAGVVAAAVAERGGCASRVLVAFQSQGMTGAGGRPIPWLGPDLAWALDEAKRQGDRHVVVAPIGFLADHVEILYDLDIEARAMAEARGLSLSRAASLNADDDFIEVLARLAEEIAPAGAGPSP